TLRHLADRVASRLRGKSRPGRTVTVRVRFADLRSVTRSVTLDAPISATAILAEIAEELVRRVLANHPDEKTISLLAVSVSHLEKLAEVQLELPLGLEDEERRPGSKRGMARWMADRAVDTIRDRFGWEAVGYGSVALGLSRSVPDELPELAEKALKLPQKSQPSLIKVCNKLIYIHKTLIACQRTGRKKYPQIIPTAANAGRSSVRPKCSHLAARSSLFTLWRLASIL